MRCVRQTPRLRAAAAVRNRSSQSRLLDLNGLMAFRPRWPRVLSAGSRTVPAVCRCSAQCPRSVARTRRSYDRMRTYLMQRCSTVTCATIGPDSTCTVYNKTVRTLDLRWRDSYQVITTCMGDCPLISKLSR